MVDFLLIAVLIFCYCVILYFYLKFDYFITKYKINYHYIFVFSGSQIPRDLLFFVPLFINPICDFKSSVDFIIVRAGY